MPSSDWDIPLHEWRGSGASLLWVYVKLEAGPPRMRSQQCPRMRTHDIEHGSRQTVV